VVLHALRDRWRVAEVANLGPQLPMMIRGLDSEGWTSKGKPVKRRKKEDFLAHIAHDFRDHGEIFPEGVAWAVFKLLRWHVSAGELGDVFHVLPAEICSPGPNGISRR
jgi:uncharacterized protein (DUF2267 family)